MEPKSILSHHCESSAYSLLSEAKLHHLHLACDRGVRFMSQVAGEMKRTGEQIILRKSSHAKFHNSSCEQETKHKERQKKMHLRVQNQAASARKQPPGEGEVLLRERWRPNMLSQVTLHSKPSSVAENQPAF